MTSDDESDLFGYSLYGGKPPSQKHSDTSRAAADRIKKRIGPLHAEIIKFLTANPRGATDEEMQDAIPMPANTQRPRRVELTQMGRVVDSSHRKLTESKREAVVWVLLEHLDPYLAKPMEREEETPPSTNAYYDKDGNLIHDCAVCGAKNAGHGFRVSLRKGMLGMWYCDEHKGEGDGIQQA